MPRYARSAMTDRIVSDDAAPDVVVLLTTWNRPHLLQQSIGQIEREAQRVRAPLVIADDHSDDPRTIQILNDAQSRGIAVIRRPYRRQPNPTGGPDAWKHPHFHIGWNALFAFQHVLDHYPTVDRVLKVDDDIVLAQDAFRIMLGVWNRAHEAGLDILALSGLATIHEPIVEQRDGYAITSSACAAAILYPRSDWESFVHHVSATDIVGYGFDVAYRDFYRRRAAQCPPGQRHAECRLPHPGIYGTHQQAGSRDINLDYAGSLGNVIVG